MAGWHKGVFTYNLSNIFTRLVEYRQATRVQWFLVCAVPRSDSWTRSALTVYVGSLVPELNMQRGDPLTSTRLVLANPDDDICSVLGSTVQVVIHNLLDTIGVSDLGVESGARVVGYHPVTTAQGVLHGPPWVISGSRLDVPDVPRVSVELAALHSRGDCGFIANRATGGVHQPCTILEMLKQAGVDQPTGTLVKWTVNRNDVALGDEFLMDIVSGRTVGLHRPLESP